MSPSQFNHPITCTNSSEISQPAGHYSHICVAGGMVYVSGQLPIDANGFPQSGASFDDQAKLVLANVDACLRTAGATRSDLVQVRVFVTDIGSWPVFNRIYAEWIGSHKPARAVAQSASLHFGSAVEVEAVALHCAH